MRNANIFIKAIFMIIGFSFLSKILGFIREILIAAKFGSGIETDAFFVALSAVTLFKVIITSSLNTTLIPVLSEIEKNKGKKEKNKQTILFLNITIVVSIVFIFLAWIITPYIIKLIAFGFEGNQYELTIKLMRIGLITILFSGVVTVFRSYLQSETLFTESALADVSFNLVYIFYLILLAGIYGITGLMVASVLAVVSQLIIQLPSIRKTKIKYGFILDFNNEYVTKIAKLLPPVILTVAVLDINTIIDRTLASTLETGSISALNYGNRLLQLVLGIFIAAITTVLYPMISKEISNTENGKVQMLVKSGINSILIIAIPATIGMVLLAEPLVRIVFEHGEFDFQATTMTVGALVFYSIGLAGMSLRLFIDKIFYSLQDTKTPMINGIITVFINLVLSFVLINFMEHRGLAFATSISVSITSFYLILKLKKKLKELEIFSIIICGIKSLLASLIMGLVIYNLYNKISINIHNITLLELCLFLIIVIIGGMIYLLFIYLFRVQEINWILQLLINKVKR